MNEIAALVLDPLPETLLARRDQRALANSAKQVDWSIAIETAKTIHWLASSNYALTFDERYPISERVIFPAGPTESRGMEDARFVRFVG